MLPTDMLDSLSFVETVKTHGASGTDVHVEEAAAMIAEEGFASHPVVVDPGKACRLGVDLGHLDGVFKRAGFTEHVHPQDSHEAERLPLHVGKVSAIRRRDWFRLEYLGLCLNVRHGGKRDCASACQAAEPVRH
jgi:hypothetical protein